ncbi:hypothetical protein LSAT2_033079 [Lamellibrachia satsuma]|nr:hypothetical protein LSAT2_033079 [Lamellibrachia satsuma]
MQSLFTYGSMVNSAPSLDSNVYYDVYEIVASQIEYPMMDNNSYNVNLQLTSVVSRLALLLIRTSTNICSTHCALYRTTAEPCQSSS